MNTNLIRLAVALGGLAVAAAAPIDGRWTAEVKRNAKKGDQTAALTFNLKSDGTTLTGSVTGGGGKRAGAQTIETGRIQNGTLSFTTVQRNKKKGEVKFSWRGTLEGDQWKGTRSREGAKRGVDFTAKRER